MQLSAAESVRELGLTSVAIRLAGHRSGGPTTAPDSPARAARDARVEHRCWRLGDMLVVLTHVEANGPVSLSFQLPRHAGVTSLVDEVGGRCSLRIGARDSAAAKSALHELHFHPRGASVSLHSAHVITCRAISVLCRPNAVVPARRSSAASAPLERPASSFSSQPMLTLLRLLEAEMLEEDVANRLYGYSLATALYVQLLRELDRPAHRASRLTPGTLERVLQYMNTQLALPLRLHELAQVSGMSESQFCKKFKNTTGLPPHRYLLYARVQAARARIAADPQLSLSALALELGFADQSHFGRVFRDFVGQTPRAWRSSLQALKSSAT